MNRTLETRLFAGLMCCLLTILFAGIASRPISTALASSIQISAYGTVQNNAVSVTQRSLLNFVNGGCVDNAGTKATDCTIAAALTIAEPYITSGGSTLGPIFSLTPPGNTTFVWRNQGTATTTTTNGSIYLTSGAGTSAYNWHIREAAITIPYTIDITLQPGGNNDLSAVQNFFGLCLVESGSGKLISYGPGYTFPTTSIIDWTNVTTFSSQPYIKNYLGMELLGGLTHLRITNNSTNRVYWYSLDHINFIQIYTEATGTHITENLAGPCINTQGGATYTLSETVYSYKVQ